MPAFGQTQAPTPTEPTAEDVARVTAQHDQLRAQNVELRRGVLHLLERDSARLEAENARLLDQTAYLNRLQGDVAPPADAVAYPMAEAREARRRTGEPWYAR